MGSIWGCIRGELIIRKMFVYLFFFGGGGVRGLYSDIYGCLELSCCFPMISCSILQAHECIFQHLIITELNAVHTLIFAFMLSKVC